MRKSKLSEEKAEYILQNRNTQTIREIAQAINLKPQTVRSFLYHRNLSYKKVLHHYRTSLTVREKEIMELVAMGLDNNAITERLNISIATVKTHLVHIYEKYDLSNISFSIQRLNAVLRFQQGKELNQ